MSRRRLLAPLAAALALAAPAVASATPIADPVPTTLPPSTGAAFAATPFTRTAAPQNPFMATNPNNNLHDDPWMSDAYNRPGPLGGAALSPTSGAMPSALCGSLTFDRHGRILSVCPSIATPITARVIDPNTLTVTASYTLGAPNPAGPTAFQNFTGGGYFFLDHKDRIWSATKSSHLVVLAENATGTKLSKVADYDLTRVLNNSERVTSALPDFHDNIWFVSKKDGKVGILNPMTRHIGVLTTHEEIENSFAVDRDAVYIVSDKKLYRFSSKNGKPHIDWQITYRNSGIHKPSQVDAGSGTTPTIMPGGYVAITDNADPMNVVVYRTAINTKAKRRTVCEVPVFTKGASATENSLNGSGRSLFVENNYGYQDPFGPRSGTPTTAGFARVDIKADGSGCVKRWTNTTVSAPTVVPKLDTATGLIYTYERVPSPVATEQPYYWAAIDAQTGATAWTRYAGSGLSFNNNYAGIAVGPDRALYLGVIGGLVKLTDG
ncbi:hypothetical protein [Conexibacter woesei]|uniref:hypothetical protein n=1 Tax=Conexibacter woesei TaxID=191495 RepID=UPI00042A4EE8|nr:hypothetical protein [Conexibacter woesei]